MRKNLTAATVVAAALTLAACGSSAVEADPAGTPTEGLTPATIGVLPIVDSAPIYLGLQEGIFAKHGVDLQLKTSGQGAAGIVPGVVSGDFTFGCGNATTVLTANAKGLDLPFIASQSSSTGVDGADTSGIIVTGDSDIREPVDLEGRKVAANTLNSVGDTTIRQTVTNAGGDASLIDFVELPFPDMLAALENGQVDAAWMLEPFQTIALEHGARRIASNYVATQEDLLIGACFTSGKLMESDPDLVEAFASATQEAQAFAAAHEDKVREVLGTYMTIDPAIAAKVVLPRFEETVSAEQIEFLSEFAQSQGLIDAPIDVQAVLPNG